MIVREVSMQFLGQQNIHKAANRYHFGYYFSIFQMTQVVRRLLLMREVWGSNPKPIKSSTRCQRLTAASTLMYGPWRKAAELGTGHSGVVTLDEFDYK